MSYRVSQKNACQGEAIHLTNGQALGHLVYKKLYNAIDNCPKL